MMLKLFIKSNLAGEDQGPIALNFGVITTEGFSEAWFEAFDPDKLGSNWHRGKIFKAPNFSVTNVGTGKSFLTKQSYIVPVG